MPNQNNKTIDLCKIQWGGGFCSEDSDCSGHGLCINNNCICYSNWGCGDCSLGQNEDILYGAECGDYMIGGGSCSKHEDCNSISFFN